MTLDNKSCIVETFFISINVNSQHLFKMFSNGRMIEKYFSQKSLITDDFKFTRYKIDLPLKHKHRGNISPQNISTKD